MRSSRVFPLLPLLAACATVGPMHSASTLPAGSSQVDAQVAISPWCTVTTNPGACALFPGEFPFPEVRAGMRHGLGKGLDFGGSVHANVVLDRGFVAGLYADVKKELWSSPSGSDGRNILSVAPGIGTGIEWESSSWRRPSRLSATLVDAALPVFFGHQTASLEWVASARLRERLVGERGDNDTAYRAATWFGASGGFFTRGAIRFGLQLSYDAPAVYPTAGLWVLGTSLAFRID